MWKPILLGGLFRDIGTPMVPIFAMSPAKQTYMMKDIQDWASWWCVPFQMPSFFPVNTILPLRLSLLYPQLTPRFYQALWGDGIDISNPELVASILEEEGIPAEHALQQAKDPLVKQQLFDNNQLAKEKGVFGVPSMLVPPLAFS